MTVTHNLQESYLLNNVQIRAVTILRRIWVPRLQQFLIFCYLAHCVLGGGEGADYTCCTMFSLPPLSCWWMLNAISITSNFQVWSEHLGGVGWEVWDATTFFLRSFCAVACLERTVAKRPAGVYGCSFTFPVPQECFFFRFYVQKKLLHICDSLQKKIIGSC